MTGSLCADLPPWRLVTDSGKPDEHFIRESAIALGSGDLLRLIGDLCDAARTYTSERSFGWARDCLLNAKLAAEAYAILVQPDNSAEPVSRDDPA